jgi:hypothetical protein
MPLLVGSRAGPFELSEMSVSDIIQRRTAGEQAEMRRQRGVLPKMLSRPPPSKLEYHVRY